MPSLSYLNYFSSYMRKISFRQPFWIFFWFNRKSNFIIKDAVPYSHPNLIICRFNFENMSIGFRAMREQQTGRQTYLLRQADRQTDRQTELKYCIRSILLLLLITQTKSIYSILLVLDQWMRRRWPKLTGIISNKHRHKQINKKKKKQSSKQANNIFPF